MILLVGIMLHENFPPITDSFFISFEKIEWMFTNKHKATFVYAYTTQPMSTSVQPLCLNITGTNN